MLVNTNGWVFVGGTIVFSGSMYALSLSELRWLVAITPLGGLAFFAGWVCLAVRRVACGVGGCWQ